MSEVLKFNIDRIQLLQDASDEQLAIAEIWVCHDKNNAHDKPIDLEDLKLAAPTLLNKFLIAEYVNGDFGTHTDRQMMIGFFPKENNLRYEEKDGKTYLIADAILSKHYAFWAYEMFVNDNERAVSMEISVLKTEINAEDGLEHIKDFVFNAVTILGKKVLPACEGSNAKIVKFSEQETIDKCEQFYHDTFSNKYSEINFTIPETVKTNAQNGLNLYAEKNSGANSVGLSTARHLIKNESSTPEKVKHIAKFFKKNKVDNEIMWNLYGGNEASEWSKSLAEQIDKKDSEKLTYFIKETKKEDAEMSKIEKFGLDSTQIIELLQGSLSEYKYGEYEWRKYWVMSFDEDYAYICDCESDKYFRMKYTLVDMVATVDLENAEEVIRGGFIPVTAEGGTEDNTEEMSADANVDATATQEINENNAEDNKDLTDEGKSEDGNDKDIIIAGLQAKMTKLEEDMAVYMAENETLKKFKADTESEKMAYEVECCLQEVMEVMPKEEIEACRTMSADFSLETLDSWKNAVKAKAFSFAKEKKPTENFSRIGLPFAGEVKKEKKSIWS